MAESKASISSKGGGNVLAKRMQKQFNRAQEKVRGWNHKTQCQERQCDFQSFPVWEHRHVSVIFIQ